MAVYLSKMAATMVGPRSNAPMTLTKQHDLMSSGAILKQRHINKKKDDFSSVLQ